MMVGWIEEDANNYILDINKNKKGREIYVFGAGEYAEYVAEFLLENQIKMVGFVVSDPSNNENRKNDFEVIPLQAIESKKASVLLFLGVKYTKNEMVHASLRSQGWNDVIETPKRKG